MDVFNKTLTFFCAVTEQGCRFDAAAYLDLNPEIDSYPHLELENFLQSDLELGPRGCEALLMISVNNLGCPYIQ
jgi:hypothetical protein